MAVDLRIPSGLFIGGQPIRGEAILHFPDLLEDDIEEVHVKLRAYQRIHIVRRTPGSNGRPAQHHTHSETVPLIRENISVWNRQSSPSPSGSQMLVVPFQFILPPELLPSIDWSHGADERGSVGYFVEIVGTREGMLHRNRRKRVAFPVLPPDLQGAMINKNLRNRVPYPTRTTDVHKEIRRGIWGGYANVTLQLILPDFAAFPLFTPIPYIVRVITITKPQKYDNDVLTSSEPLFPAPPTQPSEVELRLQRYVTIRAGIHSASQDDHYADLGGLGKHNKVPDGVTVHVNERKWMPKQGEDDDHEGSWLQESTMQGAFVLTYAPGFDTKYMTMTYHIRMKVDFPGIGNDLETEIPLRISSGLPYIPDDYTYIPQGPPPTYPDQGYPEKLDLPQSYWELQDWGEDD